MMGRPVTVLEEIFVRLERADPSNHFTRARCGWLLDGELDPDALARAVATVAAQISILRGGYREVAGELRCEVGTELCAEAITYLDRRDVPEHEREPMLRELCSELEAPPFDLAAGPLVRACGVTFAPDRHALLVAIHHAVFDAASVSALFDAVRAAYSAQRVSPPQFADFAVELSAFASSRAGADQRAFWDRTLAGAPPVALPIDFAHESLDARRDAAPWGIVPEPVGEATVEVPTDVCAGLASVARQERATPFMLLLAAFASVLQRATGDDAICVQSTYSQRSRRELEHTVGPVGNPLLLRIDASGAPGMRALVRRTRSAVLEAWANGRVPVVDRAPHGLRRINFNYIPNSFNAFEPVPFADGVTATRLRLPSDASQIKIPFDLIVWLADRRSDLRLRVVYLRELFRTQTIETLLSGYVDQLARLVRA